MHPAPSIIVFTTLSGLGCGLAAALGLGLLDPAATATKAGHVLALVLIAAGLLSSTLHLRNPQRAWRALSQWRSSWLSREGVMAVLTFIPLTVGAFASLFLERYLPPVGILGALSSLVTVYCTAMIYASLRSVQGWNTPLTWACYLAFSVAGGLVLASVLSALGGNGPQSLPWLGAAAIVVALVIKNAWWQRLDSLVPLSTPETATGLGAIGRVQLFEPPHMNGNYLTREMGFTVARKHAGKLRAIALVAAAASLLLLVAAALSGDCLAAAACLLALLAFCIGMLVERWLFFAEARHAVMNYYGG